MYRDAPSAPPHVRIVCRPVLRTFLVLSVFAVLVLWEGVRFGGPRFHVTCERAGKVVNCELREREAFGSSRFPAHDVQEARVGFLAGRDRGTTFELVGTDPSMVARTNDAEGAQRTAAKVRYLVQEASDTSAPARIDEAFGPAPLLLILAFVFVALGVIAGVRAMRRVEFVVLRGEVRATSVGRGAPQVSRTIHIGSGAVVRLRAEGKHRVIEVVTATGTPQVLADVGWLSEQRAQALCARVEDAVARAHAL